MKQRNGKSLNRIGLLVLILSLLAAFVAACSDNGNGNTSSPSGSASAPDGDEGAFTQNEPWEFTVYNSEFAEDKVLNNANDIVTPVMEKKFNVKMKDAQIQSTQQFEERLNQFIATDTLPDVLVATGRNADYAKETGLFADLTPYLEKMPNFQKLFQAKYWPTYKIDDKTYSLPAMNVDKSLPEYANDPYVYTDGSPQIIWVRTDLAEKAGYKFKHTLDELAEMANSGNKPTLEAFGLDPAVDSPEKFREMLQKINDLDLKIGDKPVIPFSIASWGQFHLGTLFDFGHWRKGSDGKVAGFLGTPEAKEYFAYLNKLYQTNLLDRDFIIQKNEQLQEKAASGRLASGMWIPDMNAARASLKTIDPNAEIRYIPWPKKHADEGFFDVETGGYFEFLVRKDYKHIDKLTQMWDWMMGPDGQDLLTWGPAESGLWEQEGDKRTFVDASWNDRFLNPSQEKIAAVDTALKEKGLNGWSKISVMSPAKATLDNLNLKSIDRAFPPKVDMERLSQSTLGAVGINKKGTGTYGEGENANAVTSYFWSEFTSVASGKLLMSKDENGFNKAWDEVYAEFLQKGKYEAAVKDVTAWYEQNGVK